MSSIFSSLECYENHNNGEQDEGANHGTGDDWDMGTGIKTQGLDECISREEWEQCHLFCELSRFGVALALKVIEADGISDITGVAATPAEMVPSDLPG